MGLWESEKGGLEDLTESIDDLIKQDNWMLSSGIAEGGIVSAGTNIGTFKVTEITKALLRITASQTASLELVTLPEQDNQAIPIADIIYFVVFTYGDPCTISLSEIQPNGFNAIPIGKVMKDSFNKVHYISGGYRFSDGVNKLHRRAMLLRSLELKHGSIASYSGTNNFKLTAGIAFGGINEYNLESFDSETTQYTAIYNNGTGGWVQVLRNTIDYIHYDDLSGVLNTISNNKYGVHYIIKHIDDQHVFVVYGTGSYSLAEAVLAASRLPDLPVFLLEFGVFVCSIIVPQAGGEITQVLSPLDQFFDSTAVANHANLSHLDYADSGHTGFANSGVNDNITSMTGLEDGGIPLEKVENAMVLNEATEIDDADLLEVVTDTTGTPTSKNLKMSTVKNWALDFTRPEGIPYGTRWDSVNDIMVPGVVINGSFFPMDYTSYPIQEQMTRGLLTEAGVWTPLDPNDSNKMIDGSDAVIDGSAGQVMTRIPKHYVISTTIGNYKYELISERPFTFNGLVAWIPPAFGTGDYIYLGAFDGIALTDAVDANVGSCVLDTSGYTTNPYPNPFTNRTLPQFRTQCQHGVFSQMNYCQYEVIYRLALTEFKTWKLQEQLEGNTEYSNFDYAKTTSAGATLGLGNYSGSIWSETEGKYIANSYRGIENPFGNVHQFLDGVNIDTNDNQRLWVCCNPVNYASDTTTNYIDTGCASGIDDIDNYIKDVYGTGKYASLFPISNTGASSSTFISDYFNTTVLGSGWRVLMAGGALYYGRGAGFGRRETSFSSSSYSSDIGVRLAAVNI